MVERKCKGCGAAVKGHKGPVGADRCQNDPVGSEPSDYSTLEQTKNDSGVECPLCMKFFSPDLIQDHTENCDGGDMKDDSDARMNTCPLCNRSMDPSMLQDHAAICTGISKKSDLTSGELKFKFGSLTLVNSSSTNTLQSTPKVNTMMDFVEAIKKYDERIVKLTLFQVPMIDTIPVKMSNLKEIIICATESIQVSWLPKLFTRLQSTLESITLESVDFSKLKWEKHLKLSALKCLILVRCEGDHNNILTGCTPNLKTLDIRCAQVKRSNFFNIYSRVLSTTALEGIKETPVWLGKLSHLCLYDCWNADAVTVILEKSAATLQQLTLHNVDLTSQTEIISNLPHVKSAVFRLCRFEENDISFREWNSLESLYIQYTRNHVIRGGNLPKLRNLKIECTGALYEDEVNTRDDIGEIDGYDMDEGGELENLDGFLECCPSLENLILKGMGRKQLISDGTNEYDDWVDDEPMEICLPLKMVTMESCTIDYGLSKHLLNACKLNLESLVLQDVNTAAFINIHQIKFPKLEKLVILYPRYPSPRLISVRAPVNQGIIDLLISCNDVIVDLELESLLDIYDFKKLQSNSFPKLKVNIKDKQMYSKQELDMIHNIFLQ